MVTISKYIFSNYLFQEIVNDRHVSSKRGSREKELCILINLDCKQNEKERKKLLLNYTSKKLHRIV